MPLPSAMTRHPHAARTSIHSVVLICASPLHSNTARTSSLTCARAAVGEVDAPGMAVIDRIVREEKLEDRTWGTRRDGTPIKVSVLQQPLPYALAAEP